MGGCFGKCCGKKKKKESEGGAEGGTGAGDAAKGVKKMFGKLKKADEGEAVPGTVKQIRDKEELQDVMKAAGDNLVVVDFFATWCGPCKIIKPKVDELAAELKQDKVLIVKVDVDEVEELTTEYGISSMPTFILLKKAEKVDEMTGTNLDKLRQIIEAHK